MKRFGPLAVIAGTALLAACGSPAPVRTVTVFTPPAPGSQTASALATTPSGTASASGSPSATSTPTGEATSSAPSPTAAQTTPASAASTNAASPSTARASDSPSARAPSDGVPALTQTFCTPVEKLCFGLPQGYTATMTRWGWQNELSGGPIKDPNGDTVMTFVDTGGGGGDGGCSEEQLVYNTVVASAPTKVTGRAGSSGATQPVNATQAIVAETGGRYTARVFLTQAPSYQQPGRVEHCAGFSVPDAIYRQSRMANGRPSAFVLSLGKWGENEMLTQYPTVEDAKAQFATPRYRAAWAIAQSAYLG